jgi:hypothetical protein
VHCKDSSDQHTQLLSPPRRRFSGEAPIATLMVLREEFHHFDVMSGQSEALL